LENFSTLKITNSAVKELIDGRVNNVLLQTAKHQQRAALAHSHIKTYSWSS